MVTVLHTECWLLRCNRHYTVQKCTQEEYAGSQVMGGAGRVEEEKKACFLGAHATEE